eukprot:768272-Hanusia_phi.AAC.14
MIRVAIHLARTEGSRLLRLDHFKRALWMHGEQQAERGGGLLRLKPRPRPRPLGASYLLQ